MILPQELTDKGFSLSGVEVLDLCDYLRIKRICYEKYVDEYYGGWIDDKQIQMNTKAFNKAINHSNFTKIVLSGETVGFFSFDELTDKIDGVSIQIIDKARNTGIGSFYLNHITSLAEESKKPIFLKVFKSNPARGLYEKFRFKVYDETLSHYLMRYDPEV